MAARPAIARLAASLLAACLAAAPARASGLAAPARAFDLRQWKLQIPGPQDVKPLDRYASDYFRLSDAGEMLFHLDAAEKGTTPNAKYVRAELRHLPNWSADGEHRMTGEFRARSALTPDKVTTMQIHGIAPDGGDAPPLLRVALNAGDLVAILKTSASGEKEEKVALRPALGPQWVNVEIAVVRRRLTIRVDGEEKLARDLGFWPHLNYFKAGCYPQAKQGTADVAFRSLAAE